MIDCRMTVSSGLMQTTDPPAARGAGAILTIDLDAIAANYRILRDRLDGAACAAVVKADAWRPWHLRKKMRRWPAPRGKSRKIRRGAVRNS